MKDRRWPFETDELARSVKAEIDAAFADTDYPKPTVSEVIDHVVRRAQEELRDRADDLAQCNKVDDCVAQAVVLSHIADWLGGES